MMYDLVKLIGEQLRTIRKAKGLTQDEVAERAGMTTPRISEIENAKINATLETIGRIMEAMDITPSELFNFKDLHMDAGGENKKLILEIHNSLLMERGLDEVKYIVKSTKELLNVVDQMTKKK